MDAKMDHFLTKGCAVRVSASLLALCILTVFFLPVNVYAAEPSPSKDDLITVLNAHLDTFYLDGKNRTGYDPYAYAYSGRRKLQTESTAMALWYAGNDNLGLNSTQLQEIYNFFLYMLDADGWLFCDYTSGSGRKYKKFLHQAWSLAAIQVLEDNGITDSENLKTTLRDTLEGAINANGYIGGDPDGNEIKRTKAVQSLPFLFKVALDTGDTDAIAAVTKSIDFYMDNCIDANYDVWCINSSGAKTTKLNTHEVMEFSHGLYLFYEFETDNTRKNTIKDNLIGILQKYSSSEWSFTNSYGEKYISDNGSSGTVNTVAQYQVQ